MAGINIYKHQIGFNLTENEKEDILNAMIEEYHVVLHANHFSLQFDNYDYDFSYNAFFGSFNPLNNIEYVLYGRYFKDYYKGRNHLTSFNNSKVDMS